VKDYRKLHVWEKSHRLVLSVYAITSSFPVDERFGLTSQLRRAASSIPANIAEGYGRGGDAEFHRFLQISSGSASEVEYLLFLSSELGYIKPADSGQLSASIEEIKRMLTTLRKKLKAEG
jgi:four helix bundle protein